MKISINLSVKRIAVVLAVVSLVLAGLSAAVQIERLLGFGLTGSSRLSNLFLLSEEGGIATWYSLVLLLACSVLLAVISAAARNYGDRDYRYWAGLSLVFLYLSADEGAEIHERLLPLGKTILETFGLSATGFLARAWLVPVAVVMLVLSVVYLRFFLRLPPRTRILFAAAGIIFLTGAAAVEMLYPLYLGTSDGARGMDVPQAMLLRALPNIEELLEMLGVVVFIYALMSHMRNSIEEAKLHFE